MDNLGKIYKFYYVANPSRDIRANVIQTLACSRSLKNSELRATIIFPRRSKEFDTLFQDLKPMYITGIKFANFFALLKKRSRIWNNIESSLYAIRIVLYLLLKDRQLKIIYCREFTVSFWLCIFQPLLNAKLMAEFHGLETQIPTRALEPWFQSVIKFMERYLFTHASIIISFCKAFNKKTEDLGYLKRDDKKIRIVPLGVDDSLFTPQDKKRSREKLGLNQNLFYITYAGLTLKFRNVERILYTAKKLRNSNIIFNVIGGTDEDIDYLQTLAKDLGVSDMIQLIGRVNHNQISDYYGASDILVIPGSWQDESPPLKLFEYMSAGRTVICPDIPMFHEILEENGLYFTGDSFAPQLNDCMKHPLRLNNIEKKIYERSKEYTFEKKVQAITVICSNLIRGEQ